MILIERLECHDFETRRDWFSDIWVVSFYLVYKFFLGCEFHGYSSDITRTWPINGKFTNNQKEVYEVVLEVQKKLIDLCGEFPTLDSLFDAMCILLGKGLQQIGIIPKIMTNQALIKVYCVVKKVL